MIKNFGIKNIELAVETATRKDNRQPIRLKYSVPKSHFANTPIRKEPVRVAPKPKPKPKPKPRRVTFKEHMKKSSTLLTVEQVEKINRRLWGI